MLPFRFENNLVSAICVKKRATEAELLKKMLYLHSGWQ